MAIRKSFAAEPRGEQGGPRILTGEALGRLAARVQQAIAYRAYERYRERGGSHGRDLEDWFGVENALRRPAHLQITELPGSLRLRAGVSGLEPQEIEIGVSPRRIVIWGEKLGPGAALEGAARAGESGDPLLGELDLPAEVDPGAVRARLAGDILEIVLPLAK